jgi:hypothetical protein
MSIQKSVGNPEHDIPVVPALTANDVMILAETFRLLGIHLV